jgi:lipopolysaccharide transport system ATP-binding protein
MIRVHQLSKRFKLFDTPKDRLLEAITHKPRHREHSALDSISFDVQPGEVLGVLGRNGAGKSTLLKLLNGVLLPDSGEIEIDGRITGLLELGTGFNPELSGLKNIYSNGIMLGMSREELAEKEQDIIDFSELGDYINAPLKTYSSGMTMRLGFSIAIHANPACFLVDEALSVGDGYFQQKCMKRIREFKQNGGSILFVSHDLNAVKILCDRALVLEDGKVVFDGESDLAVNYYNRIMSNQAEEEESRYQDREHLAYGTGEVVVTSGKAVGTDSESQTLSSGESLRISIDVKAKESLADVTLGMMIRDRFGQDVFGINTHQMQYPLAFESGDERTISLELPANIAPGKYTVTLALHSQDHHLDDCYWWCDSYLQFEVAGFRNSVFGGVCYLPVEINETS